MTPDGRSDAVAAELRLADEELRAAGKYEAGISKLLARLQKFREEADYATAFVVDDAGAREELEAARRFVAQVRAELTSN